jgi:hypothetical protein
MTCRRYEETSALSAPRSSALMNTPSQSLARLGSTLAPSDQKASVGCSGVDPVRPDTRVVEMMQCTVAESDSSAVKAGVQSCNRPSNHRSVRARFGHSGSGLIRISLRPREAEPLLTGNGERFCAIDSSRLQAQLFDGQLRNLLRLFNAGAADLDDHSWQSCASLSRRGWRGRERSG